MNLIKLFKKIWPYVRPYRWLVLVTLTLTLIGSLIALITFSQNYYGERMRIFLSKDLSARSLNIGKLSQTLDTDGDGRIDI